MNNDLKKRTINIKSQSNNNDLGKVILASMLHSVKEDFYWPETDYGSWYNYVSEEVPLAYSTVCKYVSTYSLMRKFSYSHEECRSIILSIGWARFQLGLTKLSRRILPSTFISRFKDLNLNERVRFPSDSDSELVTFSFNISPDIANVLTGELVARGMRIDGNNRVNASSALEELIIDNFT